MNILKTAGSPVLYFLVSAVAYLLLSLGLLESLGLLFALGSAQPVPDEQPDLLGTEPAVGSGY